MSSRFFTRRSLFFLVQWYIWGVNFVPPPRPRLELGDLSPSEQAFFGVEDLAKTTSDNGSARGAKGGVFAFTARLAEAGSLRRLRRQDDYEDVVVAEDPQALYWDSPLDPELEQHMIRLSSNRSWNEFLAAEQQESLFAQYERAIARHERVTVSSMWLTAILMGLLAVLYGKSYLMSAVAEDVSSSFLARYITDTAQVHDATVVAGLLAPVALFATLFVAVSTLISGVMSRETVRSLAGMAGLLGIGVVIALLSAQMYVGALGCALLTWVAVRTVPAVLRAVGVR